MDDQWAINDSGSQKVEMIASALPDLATSPLHRTEGSSNTRSNISKKYSLLQKTLDGIGNSKANLKKRALQPQLW
jgi:hypothetical protein